VDARHKAGHDELAGKSNSIGGISSQVLRRTVVDPRIRSEGTFSGNPAAVDDGTPAFVRRCFKPGRAREEFAMADIKEHMEVIGADGVHVGTVDKVEGNRIRLTKKDSGEGSHKGHHHFVDRSLVAGVEGNKVRLSAIGAVAVTMEQEK
jgi:hypothetical protein